MGIIYQVNNRLQAIERVRRCKEAIENGLKIEWETDPEKMQFEKLRSYAEMEKIFESEILRIDQLDVSDQDFYSMNIFTGSEAESYLDMIEILMDGGKLIPPIKCENYALVDGKEERVMDTVGGVNDGYHRLTLSKYFGLNIVPVVVFKSLSSYWFSPGKWEFEGGRIREKRLHEAGASWTEYNGLRATSKHGQVLTFMEGSTFVDDSNSDYLALNVWP